MAYMISRAGQQFGPYAADAVAQLRQQGRIVDTDLCWTEGMPGWELVGSVLGTASQGPGPVPASFASVTPIPPSLHWGLVLLLHVVTFGLFAWIWCFVQANWVSKIDTRSSATLLLILAVAIGIGGGILMFILAVDNPRLARQFLFLQQVGWIATGALVIAAYFNMRASMVAYYTRAENIGLILSGVLTFFFGIFYLQYHMSRIAEWKRTGRLSQ